MEITQPTVSITAEDSFNSDNTAKLTITLSAPSSVDVKVVLANTNVEPDKTVVPISYNKQITIPAGETNVTIDVEADVFGLESGDYQAAILIESVDGADKGENDVVYINFTYTFSPEVNLYGDDTFSGDRTAKVTIALSKATTQSVFVTLSTNPESEVEVEYESPITIEAGQTEIDIDVIVIVPEDIDSGVYPVILDINSVENGVIGPVNSIQIDLEYPFSTAITIDGEFDDWNNPDILSWSLPEGDVLYESIKQLKIAASEKYVYVYFELDDPGFEFNMPFNMYLDSDGDSNTGAIVEAVDNDTDYPPYENMGLEYYIELGLHVGDQYNDFYSSGGVYKYDGEHGNSIFSSLTNLSGSYDGSVIFAKGELDEDKTGRIEVQLLRSWFNIKGDKVKIAVKNMDGANNWAAYGLLPQGTIVEGVRQHVEMATIDLPRFQE